MRRAYNRPKPNRSLKLDFYSYNTVIYCVYMHYYLCIIIIIIVLCLNARTKKSHIPNNNRMRYGLTHFADQEKHKIMEYLDID